MNRCSNGGRDLRSQYKAGKWTEQFFCLSLSSKPECCRSLVCKTLGQKFSWSGSWLCWTSRQNNSKKWNGKLLLVCPQLDFAIATRLPHPNTAISSGVAQALSCRTVSWGVGWPSDLAPVFPLTETLSLWCPHDSLRSFVPVSLSLTSSTHSLHFYFVYPSVVNRIYALCL